MLRPLKVNVLRGHGNGMYESSVFAIDPNTGKFLVYDNCACVETDENFDGCGWFEWINPCEYFKYERRYKAELIDEE